MKTTLLAFFVCCLVLWAQSAKKPAFSDLPPEELEANRAQPVKPVFSPLPSAPGTNRDLLLQRALRSAQTNIVADEVLPVAATNATTVTNVDSSSIVGRTVLHPLPPLRTNTIVVPSAPVVAVPGVIATNAAAATNAPGESTPANPPIPPGQIAVLPSAQGTNAPGEETLPAGTINFPATDINQVLQIYAELVGRTILRPTSLPAPTITLRTQTPLTKHEAIQAFDAVLALNGIAMVNIGDKFVKAVPVGEAGTAGAAWNKQQPEQIADIGQYMTHVVQLRFAKPTELLQALQPFAKVPNAILPIDSSQILVLRDYTENVKRMLEMIREIDVAIPSEFISEVIPIKYSTASDIANALNSLSAGGGGTTVGTRPSTGGGSRMAGGFRSGAGGMGGAGGYGGVGGYGGAGGYGGGTPFGAQGAYGTQAGIQQQGTAGTFTDRLQNIIRRASVAGEIQVIGQTKIIADERTNSLLIFASREDMKTIKEIVAKLDVVLAQVLIEAVIIEVTLGPDEKSFGFSYLQHPQSSGQWTGVGSAAGATGPFFTPGTFGGSGGTNGVGNLTGGFNYLFSWNRDLDVSVRAVESSSRAKVLQRPRIQTSHAKQASIFVGESRPYPTSSYYGGASFGAYASIQQLRIGVGLDVMPLINQDGLVVMEIHQTIESFAGNVSIQGVGDVPITSSKEAVASVAVRDHDTIILGGLIETDKSNSKSGVPFLMNIPLLGYLFRSTSALETRKELIVLIRPTVLPTPEIAALTAKVEKEKMPGVSRAETEFQAEDAKRLKQAEAQKQRERQSQ